MKQAATATATEKTTTATKINSGVANAASTAISVMSTLAQEYDGQQTDNLKLVWSRQITNQTHLNK